MLTSICILLTIFESIFHEVGNKKTISFAIAILASSINYMQQIAHKALFM
jgi:hypothetical protein